MTVRTLIIEGGVPIWFVLALGAVSLLVALGFAVRPTLAKRRYLKHLARATAWATVVAVAADVGATLHNAGTREMTSDRRLQVVLVGLGESTAPLLVGGAALAIVFVFVALGEARRPQVG